MKCRKSGCDREIELRTVDGYPLYVHTDGDESHGAQVPLQKGPNA